MRRRRKARTPSHDLRRLALAGRWQEVHALLTERLARDPQDAEARAELMRLQQGLPLRATESALARKRREEQEMQEELAAELAHYRNSPSMVEEWPSTLVAKRRKRLISIHSTLRKRLSEDVLQEVTAYITHLTRLLSRQRRKRQRWLGLALGLPLLVMLSTAGFTTLHQRAQRAETALREALRSGNLPRIEQTLHLADNGTNRRLNHKLGEAILQAQTRLAHARRLQEELPPLLASLELGHSHISTLSLSRRADIESSLQDLPAALRERWQRLCDKESQALAAQREEIEARFREPLPPLPDLSGTPAEDDAHVQQQAHELQALLKEWKAAQSLFQLDASYGNALRARLNHLHQLREDMAALRRARALLPAARSYGQYRRVLNALAPKLYAPALQLTNIRDRLPDENHLRDRMQAHGRTLPPGMLDAARHALLRGGPSFPAAFPAHARQVQLMEDVFTATALQKVLYEMSAPTLPSIIIEERPTITEESVSFTPSPLTPGYTLDTPRRITWKHPQNVFIRRIDTTALLKTTGITREHFFARGNLPSLLENVLRFKDDECPALARAYVFKRLLDVMAAHEWPTMLGLAYAPTLRADLRSFAKLTRGLGISLEAGCWLHSTPEARQAEELAASWLHERRHRHYAQEIARNFSSLVEVHPRYIGFVGEGNNAQLFRHLPEGTLLWYMGEDGLTTTPVREELESPILYSPIFIVIND